jgi:hypothetical protein
MNDKSPMMKELEANAASRDEGRRMVDFNLRRA